MTSAPPTSEANPHVVVLDWTEWHLGSSPVHVLTIGIAHVDMHANVAVPIAWSVSDDAEMRWGEFWGRNSESTGIQEFVRATSAPNKKQLVTAHATIALSTSSARDGKNRGLREESNVGGSSAQ